MPVRSILVVEDEEDIAELIRFNMAKAGYTVRVALSGEDAVRKVKQEPPDVILLDLMLPGIDGWEVCRQLKLDARTSQIPIVMVTAKDGEADVVVGLELGADDYIVKPFSPRVLLARVRAVLRRQIKPPAQTDTVLRIHNLTVHPGRHEVRVDDVLVDLTPTEFRVLHCLARRPGWVQTRDQIVERIHGPGYPVTDRAVDVQIAGLRKKLGEAGRWIETVRGVGYRFKE